MEQQSRSMKLSTWLDPLYAKRYQITRWVFFAFLLIQFSNPILKHPQAYAISIILGGLLTGLLALCHLKHRTDGKWNYLNLLLLVIISGSYLYNGIIFAKQAYLAIGLTYLIVLPVVYYLFNQADHRVMVYRAMAQGISDSFYVFLVYNVLSASAIREGQYGGFLGNANSLGSYVLIVIIAMLYQLGLKEPGDRWKLRPIVLLGVAFSFLLFSGSRTSMLAGILSLLVFVVFMMKKYKQRPTMRFLGKFILSAALAFLLLPTILNPVLLHRVGLPIDLGIVAIEHAPEDEIHQEGLFDDTVLDRLVVLQSRWDRTFGEDSEWFHRLNRISSNRLEIWLHYLPYLNLTGHADEYREVRVQDVYYARTNAHNVYIQTAYSAGTPAGIAMALLMLVVLIQSLLDFLRSLKKQVNRPEAVFRFAIVGSFFITSLLASSFLIYTYPVALVFWFAIFPYFWRTASTE